jgi:hypothetical protein
MVDGRETRLLGWASSIRCNASLHQHIVRNQHRACTMNLDRPLGSVDGTSEMRMDNVYNVYSLSCYDHSGDRKINYLHRCSELSAMGG